MFVFPKIYALVQLVLLLVLEMQSSTQSVLSQRSLLVIKMFGKKKNTNNALEVYFATKQNQNPPISTYAANN